jgi:Protein of unknown function (DUF2752)
MRTEDVPPIYSPRLEPMRIGTWGRFVAGLISASCLAVMLTAAILSPSPSGTGTHLQLGMQPCQFLQRTGIPCPSCGMTTSFSWFARGNFVASFYIQPMGTVLAVLAVGAFWLGLYEAATGRAAHRLIARVPSWYYVTPLLAWAVIAWAWKIFIHLHGIDGWHA